ALKGTDYTMTPDVSSSGNYRTLSIPSTQSTLDVAVSALTDSGVESFETATFDLVPSTLYTGGNGTVTLTLADASSSLPLVRATLQDRDATEGADTAQLTLTRLGSTAAALDVVLTLSGTGVAGTDYTGLSTTMTIPAGSDSLVVPVTMPQDTLAEPMRTLVAEIATDAAYVRSSSVAERRVTLHLHDDDTPVLSLAATDAAASENANDTGVFTITRSGSTAEPLLVRYGVGGSAMHGVDYAVLPGEVTIPAGSSVATVVVVPSQDAIGEAPQTVTLFLRSDPAYVSSSPGSASVTITDDGDLPYVTVQTTTGAAVEGGAAAVFRIWNTSGGSGNFSVGYTISGTATNGTDYSSLSGSVTIARNSYVDVTVTALQDTLAEGYETVTLTLNPSAAYTLALDRTSTVNLQDDDQPQVNVSASNATIIEVQGQNIGFYVSRTGATTAALTMNYAISGTVTLGADISTPTGSFTIPAGSSGAYCTFSVLGDSLPEGAESLIITILPGTGYMAGIGTATAWLVDQQNLAPTETVGFASTNSSAAENAGTVNIPVTLAAVSASTIRVRYEIGGGTALGAGIDFTAISGELVFAPGDLTQTITLPLTDDTLDEADETVQVTLVLPTNARTSTATHTLTILDDDASAAPVFGFASASSSVNEGDGSATLAVTLGTTQSTAVSVNYSVTGGTATDGVDFTLAAGTLTFAPGETMKLIPNTILDDTPVEAAETILITLSSPSSGAISQSLQTLTITDNDTITVMLSAADSAASEPGTDGGSFLLTRTGPSANALTVNLTRGGTAVSGTDYSGVSTTATLAAGSTQTTITVTPLDDSVREGNETVTLTIASGSGYVIGAPSSGTVTIQDNEPVVSITASDSQADEAGDAATFTISRTDASVADALSVNLAFSGTAAAGGDYVSISTPVTIPAGQGSVVITLIPLNNSNPEPTESAIATITPGNYAISGLSSATITITDDEPFVTVTADDDFAREGGETAAFTLSRTGSTAAALPVHFTLGGTAANGTDFASITSPVSIPAGETTVQVLVSTLQDSAQESYETVTLTLAANAAYTLGGATLAEVSVQDDDVNNPPVITVTSPTVNNIALPNSAVGLNIVATAV
ncbi:MAG: Calx-beta domain-containing protein, partial [Gemmatimonas sp.]